MEDGKQAQRPARQVEDLPVKAEPVTPSESRRVEPDADKDGTRER